MALITKPFTFASGATIIASEHNDNFDTLYNDYNGNITNANIAAGAGIVDTKLAQITTAGKVSGAAFTLLANIPGAAGIIPEANLPDNQTLDYVLLTEQASAPSTAANQGGVYTKDVAGTTEMFYRRESDGAEEQISGVAAPTDGVPTGTMVAYGGATAPSNWLLCYGQAVSRTTYSDLFGIISTSYGVGDGSTTFNLPDMRGRVPLGKDNMGGASANRVVAASADSVGGTGGRSTQYNHSHNSAASAAGAGFTAYNSTTITDDTTDANIQPYQTHNYIIKT